MLEIASGLILDTPCGGSAPARLLFSRYTNGAPALLAVSDDGIGEHLATLSVNLPERCATLTPGQFFCKDWSENEGMADWLEENSIAKRTGKGAVAGYAYADIMEFLPEIQSKILAEMQS